MRLGNVGTNSNEHIKATPRERVFRRTEEREGKITYGPASSRKVKTRKGRGNSPERRYDMATNSPVGGWKTSVRDRSNSSLLMHEWRLQSSRQSDPYSKA